MKKVRLIPLALLAVLAVGSFFVAGPLLNNKFAQANEASPSAPKQESVDTPAENGDDEEAQPIHWYAGLKIAHEESQRTGRPMLVVFKADWCDHCKRLDRETFSDARVARYINESFVPLELDLERDAGIAKALEVERIPCTLALNPQADLLGRIVGYVDDAQLRQALVKVQSLHERVAKKYAAAKTASSETTASQ
jgi:thiol:disulfide interchange protein